MSDVIGDLFALETADGDKLYFPDPARAFLAYGNFGAPPTNFITRQGYKQHGVSEVDYLLGPRTVSISLWRRAACSRDEYWANRAELLDFLRPNRGGPLTLTLRQPGGAQRSLMVHADPGLVFPPNVEDNHWQVEETLDFVAFDPIWFDPSTVTLTPVSANDQELVFPIDFPIIFGTAGLLFSTGNIAYTGTWRSYPTLILTGPYTSARIEQLTLDVTIELTVPISAAQRRTITLTPGAQSVVDENGQSAFSELGPNSNLIDFYLAPDPEAAGGINVIRAQLFGGTAGVSAFQMTYNRRYFGI